MLVHWSIVHWYHGTNKAFRNLRISVAESEKIKSRKAKGEIEKPWLLLDGLCEKDGSFELGVWTMRRNKIFRVLRVSVADSPIVVRSPHARGTSRLCGNDDSRGCFRGDKWKVKSLGCS